jgi:ABC-type Fe3+-siderophore transport system permease subunit
MEQFSEVIITAIVFAAFYGVLQLLIRRKERQMLIEKGANMPEYKSDLPTFSGLKFGLLFIGIGIGVFLGSIIAATTILEKEVAYFSMIFLFGGFALVISHFMEKKQKQ